MTEQLTYTVAEAAAKLGVTEAWYVRQLRDRKLPGHKLGRQWRLTDDDIAQALELTAVPATPRHVSPTGMTPTSQRRARKRQADREANTVPSGPFSSVSPVSLRYIAKDRKGM
ncbi:excisionase family DNA-binding protein [Rhodococcus hoagii]|nr:excisionase family DNA-binding protein [Prescottella equi]